MSKNTLTAKPYLILVLVLFCLVSAFSECGEKPGVHELLQDRLDSVTSSTLIPITLAIYLPSGENNPIPPKDSVMKKTSQNMGLTQDSAVTLDWVLSNLVTKYDLFASNNPEGKKLDSVVAGEGGSVWVRGGGPIYASKETILTMLNQCEDYIASLALWIDEEENANSIIHANDWRDVTRGFAGQRKNYSIDGKINKAVNKSATANLPAQTNQ